MPKQAPRNGYYYFMKYFREREEKAGHRFPGGMPEVAIAAASEWKRLSPEERDNYNEYAKQNRHSEIRKNVPKKLEKKFNAQGISFAELERREKLKREKALAMSKFVHNFVAAKDIDNLKNDWIYLIHVNIFCKTDDDIYYPAELALCKFNMKVGPIDVYHTFFDPGEIKTGYKFAVKDHSDRTHKITLYYVQKNNRFKNYALIYDEICNFLKSDDGQSVPLFTMYDDVSHNTSMIAVEKTLATLWRSKYSTPQGDEAWRKNFSLYPLPLLFFEFMEHCYLRVGSTNRGFPNPYVAISELNKDTYDFYDEFGCNFHQREENAALYCSQSYVLRWTHLIRDHCSIPLGISFTKTDKTDLDYESAVSGSYRQNHEYKDDDEDRFISCCSTVDGTRSKTNVTGENIRYFPEDSHVRDEERRLSSNVQASASWYVRPSGHVQRSTAAPSVNDDDFPTLSGVRGAMRSMNLD